MLKIIKTDQRTQIKGLCKHFLLTDLMLVTMSSQQQLNTQ